jgi:hypothetical protein
VWAAVGGVGVVGVTVAGLLFALRESPPDWSYELPVVASRGGAVPLGGYALVEIPSEGLAQDAGVRITRRDGARYEVSDGSLFAPLGEPFEVDLGGDVILLEPATILARYDPAAGGDPRDEVFMARFVPDEDGWVVSRSDVDPDRRATFTHTGRPATAVWRPFRVDGARLRNTLEEHADPEIAARLERDLGDGPGADEAVAVLAPVVSTFTDSGFLVLRPGDPDYGALVNRTAQVLGNDELVSDPDELERALRDVLREMLRRYPAALRNAVAAFTPAR